jgi:iron-sulfur cluster repair protein YtfE (RIC family)
VSPGGLVRAPALVPLSRDHHDALVEVLLLRRAHGRPAAARRFVDFFHSEVEGHMADEEDVVLPAVESVDPGGAARIRGEHAELRRVVARLRDRLEAGDDPADLMEEAARLLHDHVRYEERVFFMDVQAAVPPPEMERLGRALEERRAARGVAAACRIRPR